MNAPIFARAFGLHLLQGSPNLVLLVYGSGVLFVRVHGVVGYHWTELYYLYRCSPTTCTGRQEPACRRAKTNDSPS